MTTLGILCSLCHKPADFYCKHELCQQQPCFCNECYILCFPDLHLHDNQTKFISIEEYHKSYAEQQKLLENEYVDKSQFNNNLFDYQSNGNFTFQQNRRVQDIYQYFDHDQENEQIQLDEEEQIKRKYLYEKEPSIEGDFLNQLEAKQEEQKLLIIQQKKEGLVCQEQIHLQKIEIKQEQYSYRLSKQKQDSSTKQTEEKSSDRQGISYLKLSFRNSLKHQDLSQQQNEKILIEKTYFQQKQIKNIESQEKSVESEFASAYYLQQKPLKPLKSSNKQNYYTQRYQQFLHQVIPTISNQSLIKDFSESLLFYNIKVLPKQKDLLLQTQNRSKIRLKKQLILQGICLYEVFISQFKIPVFVKFIFQKLPKQFSEDEAVATGGFGSCFKIKIDEQDLYCIKCIPIKKQEFVYIFLQQSIVELAISKLAAALKIGPFIPYCTKTNIAQINVFRNAITWNMEYCISPQNFSKYYLHKFNKKYVHLQKEQKLIKYKKFKKKILSKFDQDISESLLKFHALKIVHRDIKLSNVLWSLMFKKFVFCDFGITHSLNQTYKTASLVVEMSGTKGYMYPQLEKIMDYLLWNPHRSAKSLNVKVNYYYNDLYACQKLFKNWVNVLDNQYENLNQILPEINLNARIIVLPKKMFLKSTRCDQIEFIKASKGWNNVIQSFWKQKIYRIKNQERKQQEMKKLLKYKQKIIKYSERRSFKESFVLDWRRGHHMKNQFVILKLIEKQLQLRVQIKEKSKDKNKQIKRQKIENTQDLFQCFQYLRSSKNKFFMIGFQQQYREYQDELIEQLKNKNLLFYQYAKIIASIQNINQTEQQLIKLVCNFTLNYQTQPQFIQRFDQIHFQIIASPLVHSFNQWNSKILTLRQSILNYQNQDLLTIYTNIILQLLTYNDKNYDKIKYFVTKAENIKQSTKEQEYIYGLKSNEVILKYAKWYLMLVEKKFEAVSSTLNIESLSQIIDLVGLDSEFAQTLCFLCYFVNKRNLQDSFFVSKQNQKDQLDCFFENTLQKAIINYNKYRKQTVVNQIYEHVLKQVYLQEDVLHFSVFSYVMNFGDDSRFRTYNIETCLAFLPAYFSVVYEHKTYPCLVDKALRFQFICKTLFGGLSPLLTTQNTDIIKQIIQNNKIKMCGNLLPANCPKMRQYSCQNTHPDFVFFNYYYKKWNSQSNNLCLDIVFRKYDKSLLESFQIYGGKENYIQNIFPSQFISHYYEPDNEDSDEKYKIQDTWQEGVYYDV